jgi:hypothetical protein
MDIKNKDDNISMLVEPSLNNNVNEPTNEIKCINEMNKILQLEKVQEKIENMNTFNQIEILKILYKHNNEVTLNENKNGTLINLTDVPEYIIEELYKYISYVENQEKQLNNVESAKDTILNNYFN